MRDEMQARITQLEAANAQLSSTCESLLELNKRNCDDAARMHQGSLATMELSRVMLGAMGKRDERIKELEKQLANVWQRVEYDDIFTPEGEPLRQDYRLLCDGYLMFYDVPHDTEDGYEYVICRRKQGIEDDSWQYAHAPEPEPPLPEPPDDWDEDDDDKPHYDTPGGY
jgi:hypothetical protein